MAFKMNPTPYPLAGNMSFLVIAGGGSGGANSRFRTWRWCRVDCVHHMAATSVEVVQVC